MHGLGSGVVELRCRSGAMRSRVVYAVQFADEIWVVHAFQKKSTQGIKTPQREIDLSKGPLEEIEGDVAMKSEKLELVRGPAMCSAIWHIRTPMPSSSRPFWPPKSSRLSTGST